jgi:hypothetical protein
MLIINDVPIECINKAAVEYHVPATLIISVLKAENGRVGTASLNKNGTYDYGPMQINTVWLREIEKYGFTREAIQYNPCANVAVGAWILSREIANGQTLWQGVGNYHSHTLDKNVRYSHKIAKTYQKINNILATAATKNYSNY